MRRIGRWIVSSLAVIGTLTLLGFGLAMWLVSRVTESGLTPMTMPSQMVLTLDLDRGFRQSAQVGPLERLTQGKEYALPDVVLSIRQASADPKVKALLANLGSSPGGMAQVQEVRDAVAAFRAAGKPAFLFSEMLGDESGTLAYYLASAFDHIWLQPSGEVALQGFAAQSPYLRGLFDWLGVNPQFAGRWEYKSAIEMFTEKGMSGPHRENTNALINAWSDQVVQGIAQSRHLDPRQVQALLGKGPFLASEALSAGLVDQLGYRDQVESEVGDVTHEAELVDLDDYIHTHKTQGVAIAVITGQGEIHRGGSGDGLGAKDQGFASDDIAGAFRAAVDDPEIKAILFRVDSPGGDYTASDTVWREVVRARQAGKPVVVSMGDVAASGGYFVGMAADRVIAEPGTITGSIGVFTGKFVVKDVWAKLGITWDGINKGDNAAMWSVNQPFTPAQWDRVNRMLDDIYRDFTTKAVSGRHIPADRMDQLARGRVWSGSDALRLGLVDQLGGFDTALAVVRELLKLSPQAPLHLEALPKPKSPLEMLFGVLEQGSADQMALRQLGVTARQLSPWLTRLGGASGQARMEMVQ